MSAGERTAASRVAAGMTSWAALEVLRDLRDDRQIVITNQGSAREWPKLSDHPLDINFLPSAMGAAIPLGLGLALAQPQREVIVVSGEGSLLMNLGSLVTITGTRVTNMSVLVLDNRAYAVTGGQRTPAAGQNVDYGGFARAAGFATVAYVRDVNDWRGCAADLLSQEGPRFIWLEVVAENHQLPASGLAPIEQRLAVFARRLAKSGEQRAESQ